MQIFYIYLLAWALKDKTVVKLGIWLILLQVKRYRTWLRYRRQVLLRFVVLPLEFIFLIPVFVRWRRFITLKPFVLLTIWLEQKLLVIIQGLLTVLMYVSVLTGFIRFIYYKNVAVDRLVRRWRGFIIPSNGAFLMISVRLFNKFFIKECYKTFVLHRLITVRGGMPLNAGQIMIGVRVISFQWNFIKDVPHKSIRDPSGTLFSELLPLDRLEHAGYVYYRSVFLSPDLVLF